MSQKRVDQILQSLFPELTRNKIQSLIEKGKIQFQGQNGQWQTLTKPGLKLVAPGILRKQFVISPDEELQYVSRGALKLKKAIEEFGVPVQDQVCLDVGLSTGGFSDFLLQKGAKKILGIDVGRGQLHEKLRRDVRLLGVDKVNARESLPEDVLSSFFGENEPRFALIVVDVSFISLQALIPNLLQYLGRGSYLVTLVKPQFELTRKDLNKRGVVKDERKGPAVREKIIGVLQQNKLEITGHCPSPIEGENGNQEFLIVAFKP